MGKDATWFEIVQHTRLSHASEFTFGGAGGTPENLLPLLMYPALAGGAGAGPGQCSIQ